MSATCPGKTREIIDIGCGGGRLLPGMAGGLWWGRRGRLLEWSSKLGRSRTDQPGSAAHCHGQGGQRRQRGWVGCGPAGGGWFYHRSEQREHGGFRCDYRRLCMVHDEQAVRQHTQFFAHRRCHRPFRTGRGRYLRLAADGHRLSGTDRVAVSLDQREQHAAGRHRGLDGRLRRLEPGPTGAERRDRSRHFLRRDRRNRSGE